MVERTGGCVHILDGACDGDARLEASLLAGEDEPLLCLGPAPEDARWRDCLPPTCRVLGVSLHALYRKDPRRRLTEQLAGPDIRCWSVSAAATLAGVVEERGLAPIVRLSSVPTARQLLQLDGLARGHALTLACAGESSARAARNAGLAARIEIIPPAAPAPPDGDARRRVRARLGLSADTIALVAPGPVRRASGHRFGVWAAAVLSVLDFPVRLILPHVGQAARDVAEFARATGFAAQAVLAEDHPRLPLAELLAACDAALLLHADALPPAGLAACLSAGLPVVAANVPSADDWLSDRQNALLVAPDDPRAISQAVMRLLEDASLSRRLSAAGRSTAERFALSAVRRQWALLGRSPAPLGTA